ncbi:MAG: VTT domain-containing protein [Chloroflexi bacterium]|nr:VTT domain-containing protein [Chloroflexota bacterium]
MDYMKGPRGQDDQTILGATTEVFRRTSLRTKILLGLVVLVIVSMSIVLWRLDIDWEQQVKTYGYFGVFLLTLVSNMTIIFPAPGAAVLAAAPSIMGLDSFGEITRLGIVASVGATMGESTSYFAGRWGRAVIAEKYEKTYGRVERWMKKHGGPAIVIFSSLPLPFDLVGIAAGSLRYPFWKFMLYCWIGRLPRELVIVHFGKLGWDAILDIFR